MEIGRFQSQIRKQIQSVGAPNGATIKDGASPYNNANCLRAAGTSPAYAIAAPVTLRRRTFRSGGSGRARSSSRRYTDSDKVRISQKEIMKIKKRKYLVPKKAAILAYKDVLSQFGVTVFYAQQFEHTLKTILMLKNILTYGSHLKRTEEEFQKILSANDKSTLGSAFSQMKDLFKKLKLPDMPAITLAGIEYAIKIRNNLCHKYLTENMRVIQHGKNGRMIIKELNHYSWVFLNFNQVFDKITKSLLDKIDLDHENIVEEMEPELLEIQIENLKCRVMLIENKKKP